MEKAGADKGASPDLCSNNTFRRGMISANWNTLNTTASRVNMEKGITNDRNGRA
jgi:hypothetical protein